MYVEIDDHFHKLPWFFLNLVLILVVLWWHSIFKKIWTDHCNWHKKHFFVSFFCKTRVVIYQLIIQLVKNPAHAPTHNQLTNHIPGLKILQSSQIKKNAENWDFQAFWWITNFQRFILCMPWTYYTLLYFYPFFDRHFNCLIDWVIYKYILLFYF